MIHKSQIEFLHNQFKWHKYIDMFMRNFRRIFELFTDVLQINESNKIFYGIQIESIGVKDFSTKLIV